MRTVICHYHIYKNSGTSFDKLLTDNYGDQHICFDGPFPFFTIDQEQLARIIERRPNIIAFSSHQIQLPAPPSLDINVLPVVFVRHPLLRVLSIYKFKRQTYDGTTTSKAATEMSLGEWVEYCFSNPHEITHISNAQTRMLGGVYRQKTLMRRKPNMMEYDIKQALRNIKTVELLARTEYFGNDVSRFPELLNNYNVNFEYNDIAPQNTTSMDHSQTVDERLNKLCGQIGQSLYHKLEEANKQDIQIFDYVSSLIETADK